LKLIRRDMISPEERSRMIDEFHLEELQQKKFVEGQETGRSSRQQEIAAALLLEGVSAELVMKTTELSKEEIAILFDQKDSGNFL
jgi:hypothetical protein